MDAGEEGWNYSQPSVNLVFAGMEIIITRSLHHLMAKPKKDEG